MGVDITPGDIYKLVCNINTDADGYLSLEEFATVFRDHDKIEGEQKSSVHDWIIVEPETIPSDLHLVEKVEKNTKNDVFSKVLETLKVKIIPVEHWEKDPIWTSRGTMADTPASIWRPACQSMMLQQNRISLCFGDFACVGFLDPTQGTIQFKPKTVEVTDM